MVGGADINAVPASKASTYAVIGAGSNGALNFSARGNARRRRARSRHVRVGCSQQPRPGARWRGSGARAVRPCVPVPTTTRRRTDQLSERRQPTQVRTGPAIHMRCRCRSPVRSVRAILAVTCRAARRIPDARLPPDARRNRDASRALAARRNRNARQIRVGHRNLIHSSCWGVGR